MAKLVLSFSLILIVFFSPGIMTEPDICTEGLGTCGQECDARCKAKHEGENPQGSCKTPGGVPLCYCYFNCPPPAPAPPKRETCSIGLGLCSVEQCNTQCCNEKCASQYKQGQGYCDMIGSTYLCHCDYTC